MATTNGAAPPATPARAATTDLTTAASDLYVNSFADVEPRRTHALLTSRLRQAEQFNHDLAEYFKQRSLLEDAYVKGLLRLARHPITTIGQTTSGTPVGPGEELGQGLTKIKETLEKELTEIATTHTVFQRRMLQEVEVPLREKASKFEWGRTKTYDTNLLSTIKELEEAEAKAAKSAQKASAAQGSKKHDVLQQKADEDRRVLVAVRDQYLTESPFTLQHYQVVDQDRLQFLAETVARFETIQNDHARERMELAERGMVATLAFDPREEMQSFAVRYGGASALTGGASAGRAPSRVQPNGRREDRDREAMPPPPVPASATTGLGRQSSVRSSSRQSASDAPSIRSSSAQPSSGGGGLKSRFTGMLHRSSNRNSFMPSPSPGLEPPGPPSIVRTPADTPTRGSYVGGGDTTPRQSRPGGDPDEDLSAGDLLGPSITPDRSGSGTTKSGANVNRRSSFLPGMMNRRKTSKSAPTRPPGDVRRGSDRQEPLPAPPASTAAGGARAGGFEMPQQDALAAISEDRARDRPLSTVQPGGFPAGMAGAAAAATVAATGAGFSGSGRIDEEGFSVPPPDHDKKPWEAGGQGASLLDDDDQPGGSSTGPTSSGGVAQFAIAPAAPATSSAPTAADQDALQRMKSTLLSSGPTVGGPQRRSTGGPRGRRDARNSTFIAPSPIPDDVPLAEAARFRSSSPGPFVASPPGSITGPASPPAFRDSRSASVVSSSSSETTHQLAQQAANPFGSPSLSGPTATGLRASITETVNVLIKGGVIQRAMVTGEVGLILRDVAPGPVRFRVSHFDQFEKVAPNPSLLQNVPSSPGEYQFQPGLFERQGERVVVLKYQLQIPGDSKAFVPLQVTPQWRCEPNQTSFLLNYGVNPACTLLAASSDGSPFGSDDAPAKIEQISFVAQVSASVGSVQSRPEGEWVQSESKMTWKVDDLALSSTEQSKILTRFVHDKDGANTVAPLAVRWIVKGRNVSGIRLEVVSAGAPGSVSSFADIARTTVSGKFLAA